MSKGARIRAAAAAVEDFDLATNEEPAMCLHARAFFAWADRLCDEAIRVDGVLAVNQAKLLLVDRYFAWRDYVPKRHQTLATAVGHICLFAVFEACYRRLRERELSLEPPALEPTIRIVKALPPEPFGGIFIGSYDPDPEFE